ncbi:hypothetical protein KDA_41380 [Dictyobacter alpinus]|uniref:Uncharacterized protein n=1 Tax=Dictyobacter alpinus TaxID=2014873 RepID=A0A402BBD6_9CHLR|nr:hypothetical protein KDA_41380 [Dictyobacter alpinus]
MTLRLTDPSVFSLKVTCLSGRSCINALFPLATYLIESLLCLSTSGAKLVAREQGILTLKIGF